MRLIVAALLVSLLATLPAPAQLTRNWTRITADDVDGFHPTDVMVDPSGDVYLAGTENLLTNDLTVSHGIVKYSPHGRVLWQRLIPINGSCSLVLDPSIRRDSQGNILLVHQLYDEAKDTCIGSFTKFDANGNQLWTMQPEFGGGAFAIGPDDSFAVFTTKSVTFKIQKISSAGAPLWNATYGANYVSYAYQVLCASDGSVYLLSNGPQTSNDDIVLIKYSAAGVLQWSRTYNPVAGSDDWPGQMAFDASGNIVITGYSDTDGENGPNAHDIVTLKYSPEGTLLWAARYTGLPGFGSGDLWYDPWSVALTFDPDGNIVVAGRNGGGPTTRYDFTTIKYDTNGNELWSRRFDALSCSDAASAVVTASDGYVYVAGRSQDTCAGSTADTASLELVGYDSNGTYLGHDRRSPPPNDSYAWSVPSMAMSPAGSAFVIMGGELRKYSCVGLSPLYSNPAHTDTSGSVTVTPGHACQNWTASSDSSWLTITSGPGGAGSGTVTYTMTPNSGTSSRTAIISIGDATFAVEQASNPCTLAVPTGLSARPYQNGTRLTWNAAAGTAYEVQRNWMMSVGWETIASGVTSPWTESWSFPNFIYLYRVRAVSNCTSSSFSNTDLLYSKVFTDDPLVAGNSMVRAVHLTELRSSIESVRSFAGLPPGTYSDAAGMTAGGTIKAVHIADLRGALNEALTRLGCTLPSYTDPSLSAGTPIRKAHIEELRNAIR